MNPVIWVHEDCLDPNSPAFEKYPDAHAIFVFDDLVMRHRGYGLKRISYIYECLMEMQVTIMRGDTVREVLRFAREQKADQVISIISPCPLLTRIGKQLETGVKHQKFHLEPFARPRGKLDLKRFNRYWREAMPSAMVPTGAEIPNAPTQDQRRNVPRTGQQHSRPGGQKSAGNSARRRTGGQGNKSAGDRNRNNRQNRSER